MQPWPEDFRASGQFVTVEPLTMAHHDDLVVAVADGDLHRLWYTWIPAPDEMGREIERRLSLRRSGTMLPFAVINRVNGRAVGMTTYMNIDAVNRRVEIGSTWYAQSTQKSGINTECKVLLLGHAFEQLDCIAVEFRTHFFNSQSRRAIERLGAKQDGILRAHSRMPDGTLRDTVVYSITATEWPTVKSHLQFQLNRPRHDH